MPPRRRGSRARSPLPTRSRPAHALVAPPDPDRHGITSPATILRRPSMHLSLEDEILLLREQVNYLLERLADQPGIAERPVNWAPLDADQAAEQWSLLAGWCDWLRNRYQLHEQIPACWYAHAPLSEEL